jgi:hypothetical protein
MKKSHLAQRQVIGLMNIVHDVIIDRYLRGMKLDPLLESITMRKIQIKPILLRLVQKQASVMRNVLAVEIRVQLLFKEMKKTTTQTL